ncbi:SRPBCC family protein [Algibacillus agarilyticus]|uniref:SRPBCC family protein n=1 Tax=Algibacillus agarilyticus TaxID=2234133 RepID=UPI000DD0022D|nr:SRPBCC family protein [Algibacillus agarilyticus]
MSKIRIFIYAIYAVLALIVTCSYFLPNTYQINKSILINSAPDKIHYYVGNLDNWPEWSLWLKQDPSLNIQVLQPTGKGASQRWQGTSGKGSLTFIREDKWYGIDYDLIIDNNPPSRAGIHYILEDSSTLVEWVISGKVDIPIAGPFMALLMDSFLGGVLQDNLENLKHVVENN